MANEVDVEGVFEAALGARERLGREGVGGGLVDEQSLASARAAYGSGAVGFEALVAAEQSLLEFELSLARARVDVVVAGARYEKLLGSHIVSER